MSRRRKILLVIAGMLVLVPTGILYWVATTEAGLQFLVARLHKVGPITLTVENIRGTLTQGISIDSLRVEHRLSDVRVEQVSGRVSLWPLLLRQHVQIPQLTAQRVTVQLLDDPVQRPQREPRFLPPMLRIDGDAVKVGEILLSVLRGAGVGDEILRHVELTLNKVKSSIVAGPVETAD